MRFYDYQKKILEYINENPSENILILKSRQIGLSTLFHEYLKTTNKKTIFYTKNKKNLKYIINNDKVTITNVAELEGYMCEELIIDEAAYLPIEKINSLLRCLPEKKRFILYSSLNEEDSTFYDFFNSKEYKTFKFHWSICPRLNPAYPEGIDYSIVNNMRDIIGEKQFEIEYEMIQNAPIKNREKIISFRLTEQEYDLLKNKIKEASLERGKQYQQTEYIKKKLFNIE